METVSKAPFHARIYDLYVILGATNSPELWQWKNWQLVANGLNPFVLVSKNKAAIRTTQFSYADKKHISFGRIGWNEKGHQKWTHGSPITSKESDSWYFMGMELWSPDWNVSEREKLAPDFFFSIRSEVSSHRKTPIKFNQIIIFAISIDAGETVRANARKWVQELSRRLDSPLTAYRERAWGKAFGSSGGFSNSIQDMAFSGLFKVGDYHSRPVDLETFAESWTLLPPVLIPAP
jgi:hypothetical protein